MTDKDRSPDQIIHEAMGMCWHEYKYLCPKNDSSNMYQHYLHRCLKCGEELINTNGQHKYSINYAKDLRSVFSWLRGKGKYGLSRWRDFTNYLNKKDIDYLFEFHDKDCSEQRDLIAQWIESTQECVNNNKE